MANVFLSAKKLYRASAITDEKGEARLSNLPAGNYSFEVEKEGYEPVTQKLTMFTEEQSVNLAITLKPMTKGFLTLNNARLRGLIRSSVNIFEIGTWVRQSEHLIQLASSTLKKDATKQFGRTSEVAHRRVEEIRRLESSISMGVGPAGLRFSKTEKKHPTGQK